MTVPKVPSRVPSVSATPSPAEPVVRWEVDDPTSLPMGRLGEPTPSLSELQQRYPRSPIELRLLETLRRCDVATAPPDQAPTASCSRYESVTSPIRWKERRR